MSTLVFHSIEELQEYLKTAPEDEYIRITMMSENEDEESSDGREEDGEEQLAEVEDDDLLNRLADIFEQRYADSFEDEEEEEE